MSEINNFKEDLYEGMMYGALTMNSKNCEKLLKEIDNLQNQLQQKENIIKEVRDQLDYLETYSSKEDVFEDMKRRLDRIDKIIGSESNEF